MKYIVKTDKEVDIPDELKQKFWKLPVYVSFTGEVDEVTAAKFVEEFKAAEAHAIDIGQKVLPVVINSYGGAAYDAFGMVDTIKSSSVTVATIVEAKAMSAGALLFTCGSPGYRYCGPNATIMIHQVSSAIPSRSRPEDFKSRHEEIQRLNDTMFKMMAENCGKKDPEHFKEIVHQKCRNGDWYLTPEDAVKEGIANHIRVPSLNIDVKVSYEFK